MFFSCNMVVSGPKTTILSSLIFRKLHGGVRSTQYLGRISLLNHQTRQIPPRWPKSLCSNFRCPRWVLKQVVTKTEVKQWLQRVELTLRNYSDNKISINFNKAYGGTFQKIFDLGWGALPTRPPGNLLEGKAPPRASWMSGRTLIWPNARPVVRPDGRRLRRKKSI